jgi:hypothetical protein
LPRRSLLREVNERIHEVNGGFMRLGGIPDWVDVFCECGRTACLERVRVPSGLYEDIRNDEGHFLVAPGHEHGERVVADDRLYRVVVLDAGQRAEHDTLPVQFEPPSLCTDAS